MKTINCLYVCTLAIFLGLCAPAFATVTLVSFTPSVPSPQPIGKTITWTAKATDSNTGPLTFQFNILPPGATQFVLVKDFNVGTLNGGIWTARPFVWVATGVEGPYQIQVVIKDFATGGATSKTVLFTVKPVVTGTQPIVEKTANPLVVLFSAPSCAAGSLMRAVFQEVSSNPPPATVTNWVGCHPPASMTFEIAGMLPSTPYSVFAQTGTGGTTTNGSIVNFKTGALPGTVPFPTFTLQVPVSGTPTDTSNPVLLHNMIQFGGGTTYPDVATDLSGNIIWYYYSNDLTHGNVLARPLPGGGVISMQDDVSWDPHATQEQLLRQVDLAGNVVRETNMGIIQQQLVALGAVDGGACNAIPSPAPVGAGCAGAFHHDAIQTLPNGWTAALLDVEKIFPAGTQGDTSGLPVDVIGDMIVVLDTNWQVKWYWDVFDPANGGNGYAKLPVSRRAVLGETCGTTTSGCPPIFLLSPGNIAPLAHDWLHANTLYYWPHSGGSANQPGDIIWSSRHQDWLFKIDYQDGKGSGDIIWRMGPSGDFTFQNAYADPWPWFSHQHDAGIENGGAGPMTIFDNGNTRVSLPGASTGGVPGLGNACGPHDCDSRGMSVTFSETALTVAVSHGVNLDLGSFSPAMGSAQMLTNGNYFFENPIVVLSLNDTAGYSMEIGPTPAAPQLGPANVILNLAGPEHYRGWQMLSLYAPPTT